MNLRNPIKIGAALAITVGVGYALCTLAFWVFPNGAANFMNALFHGLDFRPLKNGGSFTFAAFAYGFVVLVPWAFFMGTVFGWISGRFRASA